MLHIRHLTISGQLIHNTRERGRKFRQQILFIDTRLTGNIRNCVFADRIAELIRFNRRIIATAYPAFNLIGMAGLCQLLKQATQAAAQTTTTSIWCGLSGRAAAQYTAQQTTQWAKVRLERDIDGRVVRENWSDPVTGRGSFERVDENYLYTITAIYPNNSLRAVIADRVKPEGYPV